MLLNEIEIQPVWWNAPEEVERYIYGCIYALDRYCWNDLNDLEVFVHYIII